MLADAARSVLVIVDVQERLAAAMSPSARHAVEKNAGILLQCADRLGIPVLMTEQYSKGLGPTIAEVRKFVPQPAPCIEKTHFSCAADKSFLAAFQRTGRSQAIIAGMEAHVCVLQTALELGAAGTEVFVVEDACCSRDPDHHSNAMHRLRAAGVIVTNTESLIFEWLRNSRHPCFKAISALLR